MITLKDFMECTGYRVSDSDKFLWDCYGENAISMDYWNNEYIDGASVSIVFDSKTQVVYEMQAWDYNAGLEYRWINPSYVEKHIAEATSKDVDYSQSIDDRKFIDLEVEDDILKKAYALAHGEAYDTRVVVPLDLDDNDLFKLMKLAHEEDVTLNQYVEKILRSEVERAQSEEV